MKKIVLACALGVIFALGGCAQRMGPPGPAMLSASDCPRMFNPQPPSTCTGSSCRIRVQVVWNDARQKCEVEAEFDKLTVRGPQNANVTMIWQLESDSRWEFRDESTPFAAPIMFKNPPQQPGVNFDKITVSSQVAVLRNLMKNRGEFQYGIRVFHKPTGLSVDVDPALFNDF